MASNLSQRGQHVQSPGAGGPDDGQAHRTEQRTEKQRREVTDSGERRRDIQDAIKNQRGKY